MVDIGCGEGELLACLAQPAPWLRPPPQSIRSKSDANDSLPKPFDPNQSEIANLHCTHIQGLDISSSDLHCAILGTTPPESNRQHVRWEPLETKIWHGGLESVNQAFVDVVCIVSTEVYVPQKMTNVTHSCWNIVSIEHLPPSILPIYAPMLLGIYHPRHLLITTPSYTFNARFTPPNVSERSGYPDPTKRTNRIFRHHDHKFEWTIEEFEKWCEGAAEEWGYSVAVGTIGRALEKDPWGREEECGGASQVAEFTRKEGSEFVKMRRAKSAVVELKATQDKHELLKMHQHTAHPSSQQPVESLREISEAVKLKMEQLEESLMRFEELWFEQEIAILCGGWIELLVDAIEEDEWLMLQKMNSAKREHWRVELVGGVPKKVRLWPDNTDFEEYRPSGNRSYPDEDLQDCEDKDDPEFNYNNTGQEPTISQGGGTGNFGWEEPRPWTHSDSGKLVWGEADGSWVEAWGGTDQSWGVIASGTTDSSDSGWNTLARDL